MKTFVVSAVFLAGILGVHCLSAPAPRRLRLLLEAEMDGSRNSEMPLLLPCCYDGLTARMVARAGFEITFMTGFGVSATHGFPDTQLISYNG